MDKVRNSRKNKNAVVQYTSTAADLGTPTGYDRVDANDKTASLGEQSHVSSQDLIHLPDGLTKERSRTDSSSQSTNDFANTWPRTAGMANENSTHEAIDQEFASLASAYQAKSRNERIEDASRADLSNYPWPGSKEAQAENSAFWGNYVAAEEQDAKGRADSRSGNQTSGGSTSTSVTGSWSEENTSREFKGKHLGDYVDVPMGAHYGHQSTQLKQVGKSETPAATSSNDSEKDRKSGYGFKDIQNSFLKGGIDLPENTHLHACEDGHMHVVHNCCGHVVHSICPHGNHYGEATPDDHHRDCGTHQLNEADTATYTDDVFEHPDWQFLSEFSDPTGSGTEVSAPRKPARRKNITAGTVGGERGTATGGATGNQSPASTGNTTTASLPSRYHETNATLSDLVLKEGLVLKDVYPDGNCLFAAVVDQLRVRGEFFYTTASLREVAVRYLRDNPCQEDGTPLKMFLTEHDGTWEQYLARMSREGEWGDHFVISALANVLQRKLVILRGYKKLTRTVMEPNNPRTSREPEGPGTAGAQMEAAGSQVEGSEGTRGEMSGPDELYLGHIAEAHYVSLRHYNWEDRMHQCLREKTTPSFLLYGPNQGQDKDETLSGLPDNGGDGRVISAFPETHLDFLLKYIGNGYFVMPYSAAGRFDQQFSCKTASTQVFGEPFNGLEGRFIFPRMSTSNVSATSGQKESSLWDELSVKGFLIPSDTTVVLNAENVSHSKKDLIAMESGCAVGFTRLVPVQPKLWATATTSLDDEVYLKQLQLTDPLEGGFNLQIAFKSAWPESCNEFFSRKRPHEWPPTYLLDRMKEFGVHVIAEASLESCQSEIEWKFSFNNAEKRLCKWMDNQMKHSYFYFKTVCQFLFQDKQYQFEHKDAVCKQQLRAVFFYTCEELPEEKFGEQPGFCLLYMLQKLQGCLEEGFLPDYFIPAVNLIADVEEKVLKWHSQQLEWFRKFVLEGIFLLFDRNDLMKYFGLGKCFEMLITDAQKFVVHRNLVTSYRQCFLSLNILCIQNWVSIQNFKKAKEICDATFQECTIYIKSFDGDEEILQKSVDGLPLQEKWLFAFYMDLMIGSHLLELVCAGHECSPLQNVFGEDCMRLLQRNGPSSIRVPLTIIYSESVVSFAEAFTKILYGEEDKGSFKAASHFFLKNNTRDLILSMETEEKAGNYHTGHNSTKIKLYYMFMALYDEYDYERKWMDFHDLMFEYDLLSQHYQHEGLIGHVAQLWKYFRNTEKYQEALVRWRSLTA